MTQRHFQSAWTLEDEARPSGSPIDYHAQWKAYALRYYLALFLVYCWLPICYGLFYISRHYVHRPIASLAVVVAWLSAALTAVWWAGEFRCPRCRRRYGALGHSKGDTNLTRGIFDKVCANCKLTKFEVVR